MAEVTVSGLKELESWLKEIETKGAKKIAKQALTKAAEPVVTMARSLAPHKSGRLAGSIKIRPGGAGQARKSRVTVRVGTSAKDNAFSGDEFYAPMLEYGYLKVPTYREGIRQTAHPLPHVSQLTPDADRVILELGDLRSRQLHRPGNDPIRDQEHALDRRPQIIEQEIFPHAGPVHAGIGPHPLSPPALAINVSALGVLGFAAVEVPVAAVTD
jgi:hypothetical protein